MPRRSRKSSSSRPHTSALVACALSACTSVTTVTVTPDHLAALADIGPNEEREFLPAEQGESPTVARGSDEIRLLLTPHLGEPVTQEPWGKLCTLRVGRSVSLTPLDEPGRPDPATRRVPLDEVEGAQLMLTQPDIGKTLLLILIPSAIAVALATLAIVAASSIHQTEPLGRPPSFR
jgi:hypothetical protein